MWTAVQPQHTGRNGSVAHRVVALTTAGETDEPVMPPAFAFTIFDLEYGEQVRLLSYIFARMPRRLLPGVLKE